MNEKLLSLCDPKKLKNATKVVQSLSLDDVFITLKKQVEKGGEKPVILVRAIFQGYKGCEDGCDHQKINELTTRLFDLINTEDVSTKVVNDLIGFLLMDLDNSPLKELVQLMDHMFKYIEDGLITNGKSLELFPKILSTLMTCSSIPVVDEGSMDGPEYRRMIIEKLCTMRWDSRIVMFLVCMLRDIEMTMDELGVVVKKINKVFREVVSLQEVPSLVYQTLLLSNKGYRNEVLDGIVTFFYDKSKNTEDGVDVALQNENEIAHLRSVEGTVLLHIIFAAKQDQDLGREYMKYLKNSAQSYPEKLLSPFAIGLTLAMTHIHRLEEQLYDFLKLFILKNFKDGERKKTSKWIKELFSDNFAVENPVLATVRNSKNGWDHVTHGLINLAFMLIDAYTPKQSEHFSILSDAVTPTQRACKLGTSVIEEIFKKQEIAREEILQRLLDVIMTKVQSNIQHYLDLLKSVVSSVPQIVLDCLPKFREVFDYLSMLSSGTAEGLLRAVLPLMKISMAIKDTLLVVLRKSMFSKQAESRKVAVIGFLLILKHFKIECDLSSNSMSSQISMSQSFSCSQVQIGSQGRYNASANEALCLEIIGNLRKTLTQHSDVRMELYNGVYEVICKNPALSHAIVDLLFQQFLKYYVEDSASQPPFKYGMLVSTSPDIHLIEPFAHLLSALMLCSKKAARRLGNDEGENEALSNVLDDVEECFKSLITRMSTAELADFGIDRNSVFNTSSDDGLKKIHIAGIVGGMYEVLIEYVSTQNEVLTEDDGESINQLFKKYQILNEFVKEKSGSAGSKKGRSAASKLPEKRLFSFKCLSSLLSSILCNTEESRQPGLLVLRRSVDLPKHLALTLLTQLQQLVNRQQCEGAGGKNLDHIYRHCETLAKTFLQHINGDCVLSDDVLKKDKGRKLGNICLDGLSHIVQFVSAHLPNNLNSLLRTLDFSPDVISQNEAVTDGSLVFRIVRRMQRLTLKIIVSPDEDLGLKEANTLIQMFSHLLQHLVDDNELLQVYAWFVRVATDHTIDDVALTRIIVMKLLHLHHICKTNASILTKLSQSVHSSVSDIDEDVELEDMRHFAVVNERTATPTIFVALLNHMEKVIDEVDWALGNIKNIPNDPNDEETGNSREKKQICVSQIMIGVILALHELTQSAFPLGVSADTITKVVTKLYTTLGAFTKYFLWLYTQKVGKVPQKFERLVKLTGTHLAPQVYAMITYMQCTQTESVREQTLNGRNKTKEGRKKASVAGKNRALKDSRLIPNLIYSIEQFERYLIQLSKKCKVDLMADMRRSTSRDFRINAASLEAALHEAARDDEENAVSLVEDDDEADATGATTADTTGATTADTTGATTGDVDEEVSVVADIAAGSMHPSKRMKLNISRKPLTSKN